MKIYWISLVLPCLLLASCVVATQPALTVTATVPEAPTLAASPTPAVPTLTPAPVSTSTPATTATQPEPSATLPAAPSAAPSAAAGQPLALSRIRMFNDRLGWGMTNRPDGGLVLLHTADGGQTWTDVTPAAAGSGNLTSFYQDGSTAWVIGGSPLGLSRTTDGGASWTVVNPSLPPDMALAVNLKFTSLSEGWAETYGVGAGQAYIQVYLTHDGGVSWSQEPLANPDGSPQGTPGALHLCNICGDSFYYDPLRQFITYGDLASGPTGKVRAALSQDGGKTWKALEMAFPSDRFPGALVAPQQPVFFGPNDGVLPVGLIKYNPDSSLAFNVLAIYDTHDGGQTWSPVPWLLENAGNLVFSHAAVEFLSPQQAFTTCGPDLCATVDGGQTWQRVHSNLNFDGANPVSVQQFDFASPSLGWAIVSDGTGFTLWNTTDGGHTWQQMNPSITGR